MLFILSI